MGYIKINKKALEHNLEYFAKLSGGKDSLIVGLKDNAYGHGIDIVAPVLSELGAKHCFVRTLQEAKLVAPYFETVLILVEGPRISLSENIHTAVNSFRALKEIPENNSIELAIDSGMHRDGITPDELEAALEIIKKRNLKLKGMLTHFAAADEGISYTRQQQQIFDECVAKTKEIRDTPFRIHCANTAATAFIDSSCYDANRVGLGIYGYSEYPGEQENLHPVMSLYAQRIATRVVNKGATVGYGSNAFVVPHDNFTVSNYNIGYADGFFRLNEHRIGRVANGQPILGRVSMDSFSLEGDAKEVCVFDNARHLAEVHQTIVYEILAALNANIERRLV